MKKSAMPRDFYPLCLFFPFTFEKTRRWPKIFVADKSNNTNFHDKRFFFSNPVFRINVLLMRIFDYRKSVSNLLLAQVFNYHRKYYFKNVTTSWREFLRER